MHIDDIKGLDDAVLSRCPYTPIRRGESWFTYGVPKLRKMLR